MSPPLSLGIGGRSWTDPITNLTFVSAPELEQDLVRFALPGASAPVAPLMQFLHEATHHWCFDSYLGGALALVQLRVRRHLARLLYGKERWTDVGDELASDLWRLDIANSLLRPLSEGLALFAEFDATPGRADTLSEPMAWTAQLYAGALGSETDRPAEAWDLSKRLWRLLGGVRMSTDGLRRKENLLVQPLGGGLNYLDGYLSVKSLWRGCFQGSDRMADTDLFLAFLRTYIFQNLELLNAILEPNSVGIEMLNGIARCFHEVLLRALDWDLDEVLETFEACYARGETPSVGRDSHTDRSAMQRIEQLQEDVLHLTLTEEENDSFTNNLEGSFVGLTWRRSVFKLASTRVDVTISDAGRAIASRDGTPVINLPALQGINAQVGPGAVELCLAHWQTGTWHRVISILCGDTLVATFAKPELPPGASEMFEHAYPVGTVIEATEELWRRIVENADRHYHFGPILDIYRRRLQPQVDELYRQYALASVPDENFERCAELMQANGLFDLLDGDSDALRALAVCGLCASVYAPRADPVRLAAENKIDLDRALTKLDSAQTEFGLPLVRDTGQAVLTWM